MLLDIPQRPEPPGPPTTEGPSRPTHAPPGGVSLRRLPGAGQQACSHGLGLEGPEQRRRVGPEHHGAGENSIRLWFTEDAEPPRQGFKAPPPSAKRHKGRR